MAKPKDLSWVPSDNPAAIAEPISAKKNSGFLNLERPPFGHFNWLFNLIAKWVNYLHTEVNQFAPHEASTPNMTVVVDAGRLPTLTGVLSVAQQISGTITAPVGNPRIDRIAINYVTGALSIITGTPAASPVAPVYSINHFRVGQILLTPSTTTITNSMITDERMGNDLRSGGQVSSDLSIGVGGVNAVLGHLLLEGGSSSGGGGYVSFRRNFIGKGYIGNESAILNNNSDTMMIYTEADIPIKVRVNAGGYGFDITSRGQIIVAPAFTTGAVNAYNATLGIEAYQTNRIYEAVIHLTNTGAATINLDGLGIKNIKLINGLDPSSGSIRINMLAKFLYDGASMLLLNPYAPTMFTLDDPELLVNDEFVFNTWTTVDSTTLSNAQASTAIIRALLLKGDTTDSTILSLRKTGTAVAPSGGNQIARIADTDLGAPYFSSMIGIGQVGLNSNYDFDYYYFSSATPIGPEGKMYLVGYYA